jgi:hypothetical protein
MCAEHAVFILEAGRDARDRKRRSVAGEDRAWRRQALKVSEDGLLERKLLRRSLDDDAGAARRPLNRLPSAHAFSGGAVGAEEIADVANALR